ncbi:MAG: hypothetical protein K8L97_09440 [Anaerolineae bacterium]|nr:hypothetical protein [Anaerolineae bacterium]
MRTIDDKKRNFGFAGSAYIISQGCSQNGSTAECRLLRILFTGNNGVPAHAAFKLSSTETNTTYVQGHATVSLLQVGFTLYVLTIGAFLMIQFRHVVYQDLPILSIFFGIAVLGSIGYMYLLFHNRRELVKAIYQILGE